MTRSNACPRKECILSQNGMKAWKSFAAVCSVALSALGWSCGETRSKQAASAPQSEASGGEGGAPMGINLDPGQPVNDDPPTHCRDQQCPPLPHPTDPRFRYREHCCTAEDSCGTGSEMIFGQACFDRDQPGDASDDCPEVDVFLYFDLGSYVSVTDFFPGCCRPDGSCGADTNRTLGAGCLELSELGAALDQGSVANNQGKGLRRLPCIP